MAAFIVPIQAMKPMEFSNTDSTQKAAASGAGSFGNMLTQAMQEYQTLSQTSAQDSTNLALGNVDDLASVQINTMKAESMLQTTVQLTSRAVNAYKEIMQMSV
ncbi:MAG: flagellar hook-basal body complex protein FliE [Faecalibacterium sp.]|nr:flagellar hook-basal body complex protein FliE [Faecalibacterium sp.]